MSCTFPPLAGSSPKEAVEKDERTTSSRAAVMGSLLEARMPDVYVTALTNPMCCKNNMAWHALGDGVSVKAISIGSTIKLALKIMSDTLKRSNKLW